MAENAHLRRLMDAREHLPVNSIMSEILYDARDPATHKIVLDRGIRAGVTLGLPVIDNAGVVGQVTRVFPFTSEVTLLTDKEQAIPVQVLRSGLRSVAYGRGQTGLLDLRFVAPNADIVVGDVLVTSGLDGVFPAGLAVAKVIQVESVGQGSFGRVVAQPLAGIDRNRQLLVVMSQQAKPPRPPAEQPAGTVAINKKNLPKMDPVPLPPLPATPLPPQHPGGQSGAAPAPVAAAAGAPATHLLAQPAATPAAGAAATHPLAQPADQQPAAGALPRGAAPVQNPAPVPPAAQRPAPATATRSAGAVPRAVPPAAPAQRKEGA
jgi:rod shape-determining protein MreC